MSVEGARDYGGRWNPVGIPVLYCAEHLSLAALEVLVHIAPAGLQAHYHAAHIDLPDGSMDRWSIRDLPRGWRRTPCQAASQRKGKGWLASKRALCLRVPSVVVPQECDVLVNPLHPGFARARVARIEPFVFDPRVGARHSPNP